MFALHKMVGKWKKINTKIRTDGKELIANSFLCIVLWVKNSFWFWFTKRKYTWEQVSSNRQQNFFSLC